MKLHIDIRNKVAKYRQRDGSIVCGNSDYFIEFTFDSEWDAHTTKTAHFIWGGKSLDKDFTGNTCQVPTIKNATELKVGVYVGDLRTTTSAIIPCKLSTLCENTVPFTEEEKEKEYTSEAKAAAERAETAAERAEDAADRAEAAGGGGSGESGATFIPAVSSNGTISWSNDKGLQNPDPVNIKGPTGSPGANGRGIKRFYLQTELVDNGVTVKDYAIEFTDGTWDNIVIRDGAPGAPGADGRGIKKIDLVYSCDAYKEYRMYFTDGTYFDYTVENGEDGTGGGGGTGADGITPRLRINSGTNEWEVSYDNGISWTSLGVKATGRSIGLVSHVASDTDSEGRVRKHYDVYCTDGGPAIGSFVVTDGKDGKDGGGGSSSEKTVERVEVNELQGGKQIEVWYTDGDSTVFTVYDPPEVVQTTGGSTEAVMSQKAVTDALAFPYADYNLPVLRLDGDTSSLKSKDDKVTLNYNYDGRSGTCTLKWQGGSSIKYAKKNYTIKFSGAFEAAEGWGEQSKYCLKANYIDFTHARNLVTAKLWGQMVKTRVSDNLKNLLPKEYRSGTSLEKNGITYTVNADGSITAVGTATASSGFDLCQIDFGSTSVWNISSSKVSNGYAFSLRGENIPSGTNAVVLAYNGSNHILSLTIASGTTINTTLYPMVEQGTAATAWESQHGDAILLKLKSLVNGGAVDGFPICLVINNEYQGIYTFNIPKDGWMFGMGDGEQEGIICADQHTDGTKFKAEATVGPDGSDFSFEYAPDEDNIGWMSTSLNRLINACINSDGTDLDTTVGKYLDWNSAIDYLILVCLTNGGDMTDKNYILATYDGVKWFFSAYDMDTTYGLYYNGEYYLSTAKGASFAYYIQLHRVMTLIKNYKKDKLKARYAELRAGALSDDNVMLAFSNFIGLIPKGLLDQEVKIWPMLPSTSTSNLSQIVNYFRRRAELMDKEMESL